MNDTWTFNKSLYAFNYWIEFNYIQLQKLKTFFKEPDLDDNGRLQTALVHHRNSKVFKVVFSSERGYVCLVHERPSLLHGSARAVDAEPQGWPFRVIGQDATIDGVPLHHGEFVWVSLKNRRKVICSKQITIH